MKTPTFLKIFLFLMLLFCNQSNVLFAMHSSEEAMDLCENATKPFKSIFLVQFCDRPIKSTYYHSSCIPIIILESKEDIEQNLLQLLPEIRDLYNFPSISQTTQEILLKLVPLLEKYNSLKNTDPITFEWYKTTITNELYENISEKIQATLFKIKRWKNHSSNPILKKTNLLKSYKETIEIYLKTELIRKSLPLDVVQALSQVKKNIKTRLTSLEKQMAKIERRFCSLELGHKSSQKRQQSSREKAINKARKQ